MKNSINWFEIPVKNFERAKGFYGTILSGEIMTMPGLPKVPSAEVIGLDANGQIQGLF